MEYYWFNFIWMSAYFLILLAMSGYGFHRLMMVFLYIKHRKDIPKPAGEWKELPLVTIQLPMFNEKFVVKGLLEKVTAIQYPKDRLEIQILDDSIDDTTKLCEEQVAYYREKGFDIVCIHRTNRMGYKAGALEAATEIAKGEFLLILDADFRPEPDLLMHCMPYFTDPKVALVQTRWGHINRHKNLLTRLQSIFLDGHFALEQTVRNRSGRFFTFNGTAGIWRKCSIADGGGWEHDTITEDMDLSYRVQMKGWNFVYLNDYITPAELPEDMDGFKVQQHRWTKGCVQVCQKMLLDIWRSNASFKAKMEATTHLTCNYSYLALMLLCFLVIPIALNIVHPTGEWAWESTQMKVVTSLFFFFATISVCLFYIVAEMVVRPRRWYMVFVYIVPLLALGVGMAVNNAKAVLEAICGQSSEFVRTPKFGDSNQGALAVEKRDQGYKALKSIIVPVFELGLGITFVCIAVEKISCADYGASFMMLPFMGFLYTGICSTKRLFEGFFHRKVAVRKS